MQENVGKNYITKNKVLTFYGQVFASVLYIFLNLKFRSFLQAHTFYTAISLCLQTI